MKMAITFKTAAIDHILDYAVHVLPDLGGFGAIGTTPKSAGVPK
jgi:hypothetical protein